MRAMNIYFYPLTTKKNTTTHNPYTIHFRNALKEYYRIVNEKDASSVGILKTLKYLFRIDVLLLNWIEEIPDNRGGYFQSLYFIFLVYFLKIRKKKVVWVMHNKLSHVPRNFFIKKVLFKFLLTKSDLIITHAKEGISFARSLSGKNEINIHHFPHPIIPVVENSNHEKEYDILIWGSLAPYKSIDKFLQFLFEHHLEKSYIIKIVGKATSEEYRKLLMHFRNDNIQIEDCFVERRDLEELVSKSKTVLFTYSSESILCSGALIDSLSMRAVIIGPNSGNFKDLYELGMIHVYKDYNELIPLLDKVHNTARIPESLSLDTYFEETSWKKFAGALTKWIDEKNNRKLPV